MKTIEIINHKVITDEKHYPQLEDFVEKDNYYTGNAEIKTIEIDRELNAKEAKEAIDNLE